MTSLYSVNEPFSLLQLRKRWSTAISERPRCPLLLC